MSDNSAISWVAGESGAEFGACVDADDFFHLAGNPPGASVTETYYFTFSIPEQGIHAFLYLWAHPNLKVLSGGVLIYQGKKPHYLAADYFNYLTYLDLSHVNADTGTVTLPNGFQLKINKPFQEHELSFSDPRSGVSFHLLQTAAMPPAVRKGNHHFEQSMRVQGELRLRGKTYQVDCHSVRDRSWGEPRPEAPMPVPPYTWITIAGAERAFNFGGFDDMRQYLGLDGSIVVPEHLLTDGWIYEHGVFTRIASYQRVTTRDPRDLSTLGHRLEITDRQGREYRISGETVASCPVVGWHNSSMNQSLIRWDVNGEELWGESQDVQWHDFMRQCRTN